MSDRNRREIPQRKPEPARPERVVSEAANLWTSAADEPVVPVGDAPGAAPSQDEASTPSDDRPAEQEAEARALKPAVVTEEDESDDAENDGKPFVYKPITPEDFPPGQEYARDMFFYMKHAAKHGLPPFDRGKKKEKPKPAKRASVWDD